MKIIACYSIFNEAPFIQASMTTILPHVDQIWVVDGPYKNFDHKEPSSTDGTLTIISSLQEKFPDKILILASQEWENQVEKRNYYLDLLQQGDWCFVIDGDEIAWGNLFELRQRLSQEQLFVVNVWIQDNPLMPIYLMPRLIRKIDTMRYKDTHACIDYQGVNIFETPQINVGERYPIYLAHLSLARSQARQFSKLLYEKKHKFKDETIPEAFSSQSNWKAK